MERVGEAPAPGSIGAQLLDALEARIPGSRTHAEVTSSYALAIAAELGLDPARRETVALAARLHDAGKLYLPAELLSRPEPLDAVDLVRLDAHAEAGFRLLLGSGVEEEVCLAVRHQRERMDGAGQPHGLGGEAIPLPSRIIQVACTYAETVVRNLDRMLAFAELRAWAGSRLDAVVVDALTTVVQRTQESG